MSVLSSIGNTPLVEIANHNKNSRVKMFAKLEGCNPGGSVKDRTAYYMMNTAVQSGALTGQRVVLEPTSGNTGIALAMIGAALGFKVRLTMPECVSTERQHILQAYGAEVTLTPARDGTDGAIKMAREIIGREPDKYYMPDQFSNAANVLAHYETTGPEILAQTGGKVDHIVAGMGTTGTLMGLARYFREKRPSVKIIGVEPVPGHTIQGLKNMSESIVPSIYDPSMLDDRITVEDGEAFEQTRMLVTQEGLFVGMSSGAAVAGALRYAQKLESGTIVVIMPDRGDRYLSTTLFRSFCAKCPP